MSTRTISYTSTPETKLEPSFQIIATVPNDFSSKKIPISLVIYCKSDSLENTLNESAKNSNVVLSNKDSVTLECYYYTVPVPNKDGESVGIPLIDTNNDKIRDVSRQIGSFVTKKFQLPCYISWGRNGNTGSADQWNQISAIKASIDFLNTLK